jgi:hypothetical protein
MLLLQQIQGVVWVVNLVLLGHQGVGRVGGQGHLGPPAQGVLVVALAVVLVALAGQVPLMVAVALMGMMAP